MSEPLAGKKRGKQRGERKSQKGYSCVPSGESEKNSLFDSKEDLNLKRKFYIFFIVCLVFRICAHLPAKIQIQVLCAVGIHNEYQCIFQGF